jgi:hypothetical protein
MSDPARRLAAIEVQMSHSLAVDHPYTRVMEPAVIATRAPAIGPINAPPPFEMGGFVSCV